MERSEPDDGAWDDPLGMPGEPEYPPAPIPFHERRWRHPSEVGHAAWVQSEGAHSGSTGVGRGLLVTSGAIGCILGLAVVWLMVPGPGSEPLAAPSVSRSDLALPTTVVGVLAATTAPVATITGVESSIQATLPSVSLVPVEVAATTAVVPDPGSASSPAVLQLPAEDLPTNTVWLKPQAEGSVRAVAVLVGNSPYMITTATAVGSGDSVRVMLASGVSETPVVSIDETFAYLLPDESLLTFGFDSAAAAVEGESLTVLADEQIVFTFGDDTLSTLDAASIAEGTPVVNEDGALVGLCTGADGTVDLVLIEDATPVVTPETTPEPETETQTSVPDSTDVPVTAPTPTTLPAPATSPSTSAPASTSPATTTATTSPPTTGPAPTTTAPAATSTSSTPSTLATSSTVVTTTTATAAPARKPWLGVKLAGSQAPAPLVITSITRSSPAEAAGLVVGERITAIDGVAVATVNDLVSKINQHVPDDSVVLTLSNTSDGKTTERQVAVVLGENTV